jgi:2'-5' RNA ligase
MANWFIALAVPGAGWLDEMLADAPRVLRRFHPDDLHLTVAFLGPVAPEAAHAAFAVAAQVPRRSFQVGFCDLKPMGNPRRFTALSLVLDDGRDPVVDWIAASRDPMFGAAGARPDLRPPLPHVTVARPRRDASERDRSAILDWAEHVRVPAGLFRLDRLALYTWNEDRKERQFRVVERCEVTPWGGSRAGATSPGPADARPGPPHPSEAGDFSE